MKTGKKVLLTALSATLLASFTTGLALTALADEATKEHLFNAKYDAVFEDFDRADVSDTVKAEAGVDLGERPFMRVTYTALSEDASAEARSGQIYKQGSQSLEQVKDGGTISITMRAPEGDVTLSELNFGVRGIDKEEQVFVKNFTLLKDDEAQPLPELTAEWQTYVISFANSFEDDDMYPNSTTSVVGANSVPMLGLHLFALPGETGTLDIASVAYSTTGAEGVLNAFTGSDKVDETAKNSNPETWWAGSSTGYIVKRAVKMTGGSFTVVKENAVGDYKYAVVEAEGDVEHLKIASTADGTNWGEPVAFDGYSVALTGSEKGFKFLYDGNDENGVTVKRIYLTNLKAGTPATAVPVIKAESVTVLEDFSVAEKGFVKYEEMTPTPEFALAGLDYRLSYSNGDKVEVKDGNLVFDATNLPSGEYINFKFKSKNAAFGKYVVLKMKAEDGATFDGFRFALGNPEDQLGAPRWKHHLMAGVEFPSALLDESNPYTTDDGWYYVVADIEESGFGVSETGYSIVDLYYSGTGRMLIDSIFFADELEVPNVEKDTECNTHEVNYDGISTEGYNHSWLEVADPLGTATTLSFDITAKSDDFDVTSLRLQFGGNGVFWATENAEGTLKTVDGKMLSELTYTKDVPTHVVIDFEKSGISGSFGVVDVHMGMMKAYTITNITLHTSTPVTMPIGLDQENAFVIKNEAGDAPFELNFNATIDGYQYACEVKGLDELSGKYAVLALEIETAEGTDLSGVRFAFGNEERWAGKNDAGSLYLTDGTLLADTEFVAGEAKTVYIDLEKSGIELRNFHIHTNGTGTGSFKIKSAELLKSAYDPALNAAYREQLELIPTYFKDNVKPVVALNMKNTVTAGDEIEVVYTAQDNVTETSKLNVTVTVTKDGNEVALTNGKFTAEAGVYTVTVTVRDESGNEESDTVQITVSAAQGGDTPAPTPEPSDKEGLGAGAIAGIVIGCVVGVAAIGAVVFFLVRKKKQ